MEEFKIDPSMSYDMVPLPSQGIHYPNKKKSLRVAYLTAADENILSSPNLINNAGTDTVITELLKRKILDRDIQIDDIVEEDRQAILIFLRNTAWGTTYKLSLTDPQTNKKFVIDVDLSTVKTKEFKLIPDPNDEFEYFMEKSKTKITFKFLNRKQELDLEKIVESYKEGIAPVKTKELEMMIKSINGVRDQMAIYHFIEFLPIADAQAFRRFARENKPGLDLIQEVTAPSGEKIQAVIGFGVEFFRPFYGL